MASTAADPGRGSGAPGVRSARRVRAAGLVPLFLLAQGALALQRDPAIDSLPGGALQAPAGGLLLGVVALALLTALASLLVPARATLGALALGCGGFALFLSCPANSAWAHRLQLVAVAAALCAWLAGLERAQPAARLATRVGLLLLLALALEGASSFVARSHAVGYTLAARQWFARHWGRPANSLGYRDGEHVEDGRPHLLVVGDSFVAGVGIADARARFSDRLQELVPAYQVHNLGWNGADTRKELELLAAYPFRPSVLVLSYYVNDVLGAAAELGHHAPAFRPYRDLPRPLRWLVRRSYLLDLLYWQLPHADLAGQQDFIARCFRWPQVVARHEQDLQAILDWARARTCRVLAVPFPDLTRTAESEAWLAPALGVFARSGVPLVDVRELVRGRATRELIVHRNDAHPSVWLHAEVAAGLARLLVDPESGN